MSMKNICSLTFLVCCLLCLGTAVSAQNKPKKKKKKKKGEVEVLATQTDSISYALGMDVGSNLKGTGLDVNIEQIYEGMKAASAPTVEGEEPQPELLDEKTRASLLQDFQRMIQEKKQKEMEEKAAVAKEEARLFLEQNGQREGVVTLPSGLQYEIIREGTGPKPGVNNTVTVHYEGKLMDEQIFDSSYQRGQPIDLKLNQVIQGWTEGLQLMNTGAKYKLYVPSDLGYGERGAGAKIGPNETLIFDIELIAIK